jgi:hypothetical protein
VLLMLLLLVLLVLVRVRVLVLVLALAMVMVQVRVRVLMHAIQQAMLSLPALLRLIRSAMCVRATLTRDSSGT